MLGYWLSIEIKPLNHVGYIQIIAYGILWTIKRLKSAGVKDDNIFNFYSVKVCSLLEYKSPVFTSLLKNQNVNDIEQIQKIVMQVILGDN